MDSIHSADVLSVPPEISPQPELDDTQLPCSDGEMVENFHEHPQSILLTSSITPWLQQLRPDGQFIIGQNSGIYWRQTEPPLDGCKAPDWYCVLGVPKYLKTQDNKVRTRQSYVLWKEHVIPTLAIEFVSRGRGREEHDTTPYKGKFWVYEQGIGIPYYAIFDDKRETVELYELVEKRYRRVTANERGRLAVPPLKLELGIWYEAYDPEKGPVFVWLRFWDDTGKLLLAGDERAEKERAEKERLAAKLREAGIDPDA